MWDSSLALQCIQTASAEGYPGGGSEPTHILCTHFVGSFCSGPVPCNLCMIPRTPDVRGQGSGVRGQGSGVPVRVPTDFFFFPVKSKVVALPHFFMTKGWGFLCSATRCPLLSGGRAQGQGVRGPGSSPGEIFFLIFFLAVLGSPDPHCYDKVVSVFPFGHPFPPKIRVESTAAWASLLIILCGYARWLWK